MELEVLLVKEIFTGTGLFYQSLHIRELDSRPEFIRLDSSYEVAKLSYFMNSIKRFS